MLVLMVTVAVFETFKVTLIFPASTLPLPEVKDQVVAELTVFEQVPEEPGLIESVQIILLTFQEYPLTIKLAGYSEPEALIGKGLKILVTMTRDIISIILFILFISRFLSFPNLFDYYKQYLTTHSLST